MTPRDDATEAQVAAARPGFSTWLSANAGSGKTRVLTDRVARLLFEDVEPQRILCLTYTKAAASEMQNRLFSRLGSWAMLPHRDLAAELGSLGIEARLTDDDLRRARTLFARAIETPGGLKIQTIHSFCASILRRFPIEAGLSPDFTEMEDRAAEILRGEILNMMADGPDRALVQALASIWTGAELDDLLREITANAGLFDQSMTQAAVLEWVDEPRSLDADAIRTGAYTGEEKALLASVVAQMRMGTDAEAKKADKIEAIGDPGPEKLMDHAALLLNKDGTVPKKLLNESTKEGLGEEQMAAYAAFLDRLCAALQRTRLLEAARKTAALNSFAHRFVELYEAAKQARGWLDFDDLINRTRDLLSDPAVAQWVLYRIDGGIDHILVDEAQDTSPPQWDVIRRLASEMLSGEGAHADRPRTIFVVGDKKQSIYSFQGADPREFDRMEQEFGGRLREMQADFQSRSLLYSFRSAEAILKVVDATFTGQQGAGFREDEPHKAFKSLLPGRVDLWPAVPKNEKEPRPVYTDPLDMTSPEHHDKVLARRIAGEIERMVHEKVLIPDEKNKAIGMRAVSWGDFLILVRRRSDLFHQIIRECKSRGLPIAGADRLRVGAELAVRDLLALLGFLATPEDDLALATALRSPLFGLSEGELYDLAHNRGERFLWQELRDRAEDFPETHSTLIDLRARIDYLRPFDLLQRILVRHGGRKRLIARLGQEAKDGIDAILSQAMAYERSAVPSLTGFLVWAQQDDLDIKRQMDAASDQIRVMSVHGAKGLEAPVVILPDTASWKLDLRGSLLIGQRGQQDKPTVLWKPRSEEMPDHFKDLVDEKKARMAEERQRLLYVAMTRAEKWLIVACAGDRGKNGDCWYDQVEQAMQSCGADPVRFAFEPGLPDEGLRIETGDWGLPVWTKNPGTETPETVLPAYFDSPAPTPDKLPEPRSPSRLGGPKALPSEDALPEDLAMARGTLVHKLLEDLPACLPANRELLADRVCTVSGLDPALAADARAEAFAVLDSPDFKKVFAPDALAEVAISFDHEGQRYHGTIDRLLIEDDELTVIDFKTNMVVPADVSAVPEGLLRQMGAYATGLSAIYPGYRITCAILWTASKTLMPLPHDIVTRAFDTAPYLDDFGEAS